MKFSVNTPKTESPWCQLCHTWWHWLSCGLTLMPAVTVKLASQRFPLFSVHDLNYNVINNHVFLKWSIIFTQPSMSWHCTGNDRNLITLIVPAAGNPKHISQMNNDPLALISISANVISHWGSTPEWETIWNPITYFTVDTEKSWESHLWDLVPCKKNI